MHAGLMMDIIPRYLIRESRCYGGTNSKHQARIKSFA